MREIKNYPSYRITENGIVINIKTNKNVKQQIDKDGYLRVCLYNKNLRTKQFVHRLVATAFIPNPQSLPDCCCRRRMAKHCSISLQEGQD